MRELTTTPLVALRQHWPEYLMEGAELGLFMISACVFGLLLFHPSAPATHAIESEALRRAIVGLAMGLTAVALICSPIGQRSGAHMNPAVTLAFLRLGKVAVWDALFYIVAQFVGAVLGVLAVSLFAADALSHPSVNHVTTTPGGSGPIVAWVAEFVIAFMLMSVLLIVSNRISLARFTPLFAGAMVSLFVTLEAPLSGASLNPARTFGSAYWSQVWTGLWIYFSAPTLAMLAAAELHVRLRGSSSVLCAKLHHFNRRRCIFNCSFDRMQASHRIRTGAFPAASTAHLTGDAHAGA